MAFISVYTQFDAVWLGQLEDQDKMKAATTTTTVKKNTYGRLKSERLKKQW